MKKLFGLDFEILSEDINSITINYNGNEYTIKKSGEFDGCTRYAYYKKSDDSEIYYDNIGFDVIDGLATCNGYTYKEVNGEECNDETKDAIKIFFPTLREIFDDEKIIQECIYYFLDVADDGCFWGNNDFESFLIMGWGEDVSGFFEGLFFSNNYLKTILNGKDILY